MLKYVACAVGFFLAAAGGSALAAGPPDPATSTTPDCIVVDPGGATPIEVIVRDATYEVCGGVTVEIVFSPSCTGLREFPCPGSQPTMLTATTNEVGRAVFLPRIGGCCAVGGAVEIRAGGLLLRSYDSVGSGDADGDLAIALSDFVLLGSAFDQSGSCLDICACDGVVDLFDFVQFSKIWGVGCRP